MFHIKLCGQYLDLANLDFVVKISERTSGRRAIHVVSNFIKKGHLRISLNTFCVVNHLDVCNVD